MNGFHFRPDDKMILDEIGQLNMQSRWRLEFPANLEKRFVDSIRGKYRRESIVAGLVGIGSFNVFLIADYFFRPEVFAEALAIRLLLATLPALTCIYWVYRDGSEQFRRLATNGVLILVNFAGFSIYELTSSSYATYDPFLFCLTPIIGNTILPNPFRDTLRVNLFLTFICLLVLLPSETTPQVAKAVAISFWIIVAVITLHSRYRTEKLTRQAFLIALHDHIRHREVLEQNDELSIMATTDKLTGLANRRKFDEGFHQLWNEAISTETGLAALMIDIDHFKSVNDTYGHAVGDICLQTVATMLQSQARDGDLLARYGGEEFCLLLPDATLKSAMDAAQEIHASVAQLQIPELSQTDGQTLTVSIGVACHNPTLLDSKESLLASADQALYVAKRSGRNQTRASRYKQLAA